MYRPGLALSRTKVPVVGKAELESIASRCVRQFTCTHPWEAMPLRVDEFCELYMGLNVEYQHLSHNGCYLGMAIFQDGLCLPVYRPETGKIERKVFNADTILLDCALLEPGRARLRRFTAMHECAHQLLHAAYYQSACAPAARVACNVRSISGSVHPREWNDVERMEWQANYLAAALLMPAPSLRAWIRSQEMEDYYRYRLSRGTSPRDAMRLAADEVSSAFEVSSAAAAHRLRALGFGQSE